MITTSNPSQQTGKNHEIIFPQGEFWSDEPPLETYLHPNEQGWLWSEQLQLYLGIYEDKLRYFRADGELIPSPSEAASQERQEKELALQKIEQLQAKLRELGVNPEE